MNNRGSMNHAVTRIDPDKNPEKSNKTAYIYNFITLYLGTLATTSILTSSFKFGMNIGELIFITFLLSSIPFLAFYNQKRKVLVNIIITLLICLFIVVKLSQIITSSIYAINCIIKGISIPYGLNLATLDIASFGGSGDANANLFIMLFTLLASLLTGYVVLHRHSQIIAMFLPIIIAIFGISFDVFPSVTSIILTAAYFMAVLSMTSKPKLQLNTSIPVLVYAMLVMVFIGSYLFVHESNYERIPPFEKIGTWAKSSLDSIFNYGQKNIDSSKGGINGGKLGEFDGVAYSNNSMFSLQASPNGGFLYYRGFYGQVYQNNSWEDLPSEFEQKYEQMFQTFKKNKIDTNVQTTTLLNIMDSDEQLQKYVKSDEFDYKSNVIKKEYKIVYFNADSHYWYLPYACTKLTDLKSANDGYPINNTKGVCSGYSYYADHVDYAKIKEMVDNYKGTNASMTAYVNWELQYRKYVYDAYTIMPENSLEEIKAEAKKHPVNTESEKQDYINSVVKYLSDNYKYSLNPGRVPQGKDFVEYFLYSKKEGYCSYFATAATLMLRAAGIPARYVEGYAVADDLIKSGTKDIKYYYNKQMYELTKNAYYQYTVTVSDNSAHAWVEVYKDGYGWVPVEATPGAVGGGQNLQNSSSTAQSDEMTTTVSTENTSIADTSSPAKIDDATKTALDSSENQGGKNSFAVIAVTAFILVMTFMMVMWYLMYTKARKSVLIMLTKHTFQDTNAQILNVYKYIEKLCIFLSISKSDLTDYEAYSNDLKINSKYFSECNINGIINIVLKARFGNDRTTEEEALLVTQEAFQLRTFVYDHLSRLQKLKFRYLYKL